MKTKVTLLLAFCFIISSCIKDFYGHPDDEIGVLTETNYYYSDDFKTEFLTIQVDELNAEIKKLKEILGAGQGDDKTLQDLANATQKRDSASTEISNIETLRELLFKKRRPPLPGPCPKNENCDLPGIQYIVVPPGLAFYELIVYDLDGNVLGQTEGEPVGLNNVDGLIDYLVFISDGSDYSGPIKIQIREKLGEGSDLLTLTLDSEIGL